MTAATLSPNPQTTESQLTKSDVAALSHAEIAGLTTTEMLRVIAVADLPFARQSTLAYQSPGTLRQLTHLACRCCRNQGY
jgi:hypothetical protein